jgi:hypothetical protein
MSLSGRIALAGILICALAGVASAQETVNISVPLNVTFQVVDVHTPVSTTATVSFSDALLIPGHVLRISARADSIEFVGPSGNKIPASSVSWTASNAQGGVGSSGTLSSSTAVLVFQSGLLPISGRVDLTFRLQPPTNIHAGTHTMSLRWSIEAVLP